MIGKGINKIAGWIYKKLVILGVKFPFERMVRRDLAAMNPEENADILCTDYYVAKIAKCIMILLVGALFALAVSIKSRSDKILTDGRVGRSSYEQGNMEVDLKAKGYDDAFHVTVEPSIIDKEDLTELAEEFQQMLPELILGENASLDEVSEDLVLEDTYAPYPFEVSWTSSMPDVLSSSGRIFEETTAELELTANITYIGSEWSQVIRIRVVPPVLSEEARVRRTIQNMLEESEKSSRNEEEWVLPDSFEGTELEWEQEVKDYGPLLFVLTILTAAAIFGLSDKDLHTLLEKRKEQMRKEYPDVLHMLVLYLGAGMTIRGALGRMVSDLEEKDMGPVYKEILIACRELSMGISEPTAYERLGKRTGLPEYMRLCALLSQNLKKGNATLLIRLREEAYKATQDRLSYGKRLGEEAETKLLLPCVMMLAVVLVMLTIPAFSAIG